MPSIVIRERDLTSAGNLEVTTNTVYIPGYSNMGPTNIPTLCETLADFQAIFGSEPYMFREAQEWPTEFVESAKVATMGKFYEKGEYEKSYIMAAELLKLGIPVLYERVASTIPVTIKEGETKSPLELWTSMAAVRTGTKETENKLEVIKAPLGATKVLDIKSTYSGKAAKYIHFNIINNEVVLNRNKSDEKTAYYYTIVVWRDASVKLGTSKIAKVSTNFTFDSEIAANYKSCKLVYPAQSFVDNSGLVKIEIANIDASTITLLESEKIEEQENGTKKVVYQKFDMLLGLETAEWSTGNTNKVTIDNDEFKVTDMYTMLANSKYDPDTREPLGLYRLLDKGEYVIKFITSGAYPIFEYGTNSALASNFAWVAAERGDCTALIDHTPNNERTLWAEASGSVFKSVKSWASSLSPNSLGEDSATYSAMFTPWGVYNCTIVNKSVMLPASFGYLAALGVSTQLNGSWAAAAGVARGSVPGLVSLCQNVTNAIADSYSNRDSISINPITNIKPYGLLIWGNRTLKNNAKKGDLTATSFLSIRQLTNDVKRTVWVAAKTLTFEQNNDVLWINFKSKIIPTLDQMVSGGGISGYEIKKQKTTKKATVKAKVILYAIEPVEDWDITIELADQSTEITG